MTFSSVNSRTRARSGSAEEGRRAQARSRWTDSSECVRVGGGGVLEINTDAALLLADPPNKMAFGSVFPSVGGS